MRHAINTEHIEGRIYQHDLAIKKVQNQNSDNFGKEFISGNIDIAVDEEGINIIQVHFTYATEFTKSGAKSSTYGELKKIIDSGKTWIADGKEEATKVKIDNIALALNDFYTQDGTQVSLKVNEGGFVSIVNELNSDLSERSKFTTDMVITNIKNIDADEENGIKEDYISVHGAVFNFRNDVLPVEFVVKNPAGMKYFESLEASESEPLYTKVWGKIDWSPEVGSYTEESAFGEAVVHMTQKKKRQWVITGAAKYAYDFGEEGVLTRDELKQAIQNRQVYLTDVKRRRDEYNAQKGSPSKNSFSAINSPSNENAIPKSQFNF